MIENETRLTSHPAFFKQPYHKVEIFQSRIKSKAYFIAKFELHYRNRRAFSYSCDINYLTVYLQLFTLFKSKQNKIFSQIMLSKESVLYCWEYSI